MEIDKIYLGNCFDYFDKIEDCSIDLIFTDPPYLNPIDDIYNWNSNLDWQLLTKEFYRILKLNGQIAIFSDFLTAVSITSLFSKYFKFRFYWIWEKANGQPVNLKRPISETEFIIVYAKRESKIDDLTFNWKEIAGKGHKYFRKFSRVNPTRRNLMEYCSVSDGLRFPRQILSYPAKCNLPMSERTNHPTQKPVALCELIIKALSNPNDLILDPFSGSGSISIAAYRLERHYLAFEINPDYYYESIKRLENEKAQLKIFKSLYLTENFEKENVSRG